MDKIYPINGLFFYRLLFMLMLLLGEAIYCYKLPRKKNFTVKLILALVSSFLVALAFPIPTSNDFYSMFMFFAFFAYTYLMGLMLFNVPKTMLLFCLICGYTMQHIAYELYQSLSSFIVASDYRPGGLYNYDELSLFSNSIDFCLWIVSYINVYWLMFIFFAFKIKKGQDFNNVGGLRVILLGMFFVVSDIVINSITSFYSTIHYERIYIGIISLVNCLLCVIGVYFIFEVYYSNNLKREYLLMNQIRAEEKEQYQISKETIDMINLKCHDFRHQIRLLGEKQNISQSAIEEINKLINIYDSNIKTSNEALNVILNEKTLICNKYDISFSCIINGDLLNFMKEEDIYSLFGNILDNAIEAVKVLPKDKRNIRLSVKSKGNMISISEKNAYQKILKTESGTIQTTKADVHNHGFGLKSIKVITEKYDGNMNLHLDNNMFELTLLFLEK